MSDLSHIDLKNIPEHIAIIMDGNGRWAKSHGEDRLFGHSKGVDAVETPKRQRAQCKIPDTVCIFNGKTESPSKRGRGLMNYWCFGKRD